MKGTAVTYNFFLFSFNFYWYKNRKYRLLTKELHKLYMYYGGYQSHERLRLGICINTDRIFYYFPDKICSLLKSYTQS